jgi:CRISPR/Cas system-associated exonuclease Cas4 (RecB family)
MGLSGKLDILEFHRQRAPVDGMTDGGLAPTPTIVVPRLPGTAGDGNVNAMAIDSSFAPDSSGDRASPGPAGEKPASASPDSSADRIDEAWESVKRRPPQAREGAIAGDAPHEDRAPTGVRWPGLPGFWLPFPVEYKRGRLRKEEGYEVQLCAQALCLEEMLGARIPAGAIFYGKTHRRLEIAFDERLRADTEAAAARLHDLIRTGKTPPGAREPKCERCSMLELCLPGAARPAKSAAEYLARALGEQAGTGDTPP